MEPSYENQESAIYKRSLKRTTRNGLLIVGTVALAGALGNGYGRSLRQEVQDAYTPAVAEYQTTLTAVRNINDALENLRPTLRALEEDPVSREALASGLIKAAESLEARADSLGKVHSTEIDAHKNAVIRNLDYSEKFSYGTFVAFALGAVALSLAFRRSDKIRNEELRTLERQVYSS